MAKNEKKNLVPRRILSNHDRILKIVFPFVFLYIFNEETDGIEFIRGTIHYFLKILFYHMSLLSHP